MYRFARAMTGSPALAEDIVQEVFLALMRDLERYDASRAGLRTYLFGIARNLARYKARSVRRLTSLDHAEFAAAFEDPARIAFREPGKSPLATMPRRTARTVPRGDHSVRLARTRLCGDCRGAERTDRDCAIAFAQRPAIAARAAATARRRACRETVPHMNSEDVNTDEKELQSALRALAHEDQGLATPPHVEARLMRAWDETRGVRGSVAVLTYPLC